METCAGKCAKYLLFLFNLIFLLSGAGVLGIGIWIRVDKNIEQLTNLLNLSVDGYIYTAAYILIGVGSFVFIIAFLGCCGAITENKCLLGSYIFFLVIIFCGEFGGGIAAAVYKDKVLGQLDGSLKVTFDTYTPRTNTTGGNVVAVAWDYLQVWFSCCGAQNFTNYRDVNFSTPGTHVPDTCCVLKNPDPIHPEPKDRAACQLVASDPNNVNQKSEVMYTQGCIQGIENMLKKHTNILIGVGVGVAFLQLLGIVLACCVCRGSKEHDSD